MTDSPLRLSLRLLGNGLRYRYLKMTGKPGRPQAISLEVTHQCIAQCIMCNIWKIPPEVPNLPMNDWIRLLSSGLLSDLRELDITGGEPFLRKDLDDLFLAIGDLRDAHLKSLRSIAITTNGILTRTVLQWAERHLPRLRERNTELVIVCAMDGVGKLHERIKNYEGAWQKVNETIQGLMELRGSFPNLIIGVKTTILPINIGELEAIAQYADSGGLFTIISPCIITEGRYLNSDQADNLAFSQEDVRKMTHFFESNRFKWSYHGARLVQYFKTGIMRKPCSCGFNYFFVRSNGELFLCPLINKSTGNIKETHIRDLYLSEKAYEIRRKMGQYPECQKCTEPGLERYALPYEGFIYLSLLLKMGRKEFLQLHRHMGLDKYFS